MNFKKFWGGGEKMACLLAQGARKNGHQVRFLVSPGTPLQKRLNKLGIEADSVNYRNPLRLWSAFREKGPYELILTQSSQENRYAYYLSLLSGTPIVTRLGVSAKPSVDWLKRWLHSWTVRVNFANFQAGLDLLRDVYAKGLNCPVLLPNAVIPPVSLSDTPRKNLGIPEEAIVIGMVGRLEERKGCLLLLSAFKSLAGKYSNLHMLMVGQGGLQEQLERHANDQIHIKGFAEEVGDVYRCIDMLALPVLWGEGTSNAVLEAMSLGCAVICTNDGGMGEVITDGQNGLLIEKGDQAALERAIIRLIEDQALRFRLGERARQWVQDNSSMDKMIDIFLFWLQWAAFQKKGTGNESGTFGNFRHNYH
ncbi:MAG: glycosyltransferase family 4 protein [Desulfobacteraceae bacterium]|nr:glycosyltransferase family 4 protein [Desulfobacteraceae bacterium]